MTWPWISPVSGSNFSFVFCGNRNGCEKRASRLSSTSSSISAYSSSFESFFLAPFISLLLLTAAECRCGFTRETRACGTPSVAVSSVWLILQISPTADLQWQTSPLKIKAVSAVAHSTVKIQPEPRT